MKTPIAAGALLSALPLLAATDVVAQGSESRTNRTRPLISGTFTDVASGQGTFSGNIALGRFEVQQGSLVAVGTLTGVLAQSTSAVLGRVNEEVALPVAVVRATCQLLHLDIGPLDLELLDVPVHLEKDALGITMRDGPKRALLCSTARRLAADPTFETVATKLNAVLRAMDPPR
jgi:hypothetical protein